MPPHRTAAEWAHELLSRLDIWPPDGEPIAAEVLMAYARQQVAAHQAVVRRASELLSKVNAGRFWNAEYLEAKEWLNDPLVGAARREGQG